MRVFTAGILIHQSGFNGFDCNGGTFPRDVEHIRIAFSKSDVVSVGKSFHHKSNYRCCGVCVLFRDEDIFVIFEEEFNHFPG